MLALVLTVPISVTVNTNVGLICAAGTRAVKGSFLCKVGLSSNQTGLPSLLTVRVLQVQ